MHSNTFDNPLPLPPSLQYRHITKLTLQDTTSIMVNQEQDTSAIMVNQEQDTSSSMVNQEVFVDKGDFAAVKSETPPAVD